MTDPDRFQDQYRIPSARLSEWDYGSNAAYFVTICVQKHACVFGSISDGMMNLNQLGQAAQDCWQQIPFHFPFVILGESVIMPNHVHGIIIIDKPTDVETHDMRLHDMRLHDMRLQSPMVETRNVETPTVETQNLASLPQRGNHFGPQSRNLASVVRGFKIGVTKFARQNNIPFQWQARYHDHIVRDKADFERISEYICYNPHKWIGDRYYSETIS